MTTKEGEGQSEIDHISHFTRTIIDIRELKNILKKNSNHGVCGGHNLGNTCFMNSSIACLSNCTELTTYFLSGKYKQSINKKNKAGLGGKLANDWYDLLEEYWNSGKSAGNPSSVKKSVAKKDSKFAGFGQQDSNEFMTEFLSILSEDLNKSDKKEYKELKEKGENESELECAERFWNLHKKRNDSIITDLFSGLLKSDVICSKCGFDNITFDPFNALTLAIPPEDYVLKRRSKNLLYRTLEFFYIPKYSIRENCRIKFSIKRETPFKDMVEEINKIEGFKYNLKRLVYIKVLDAQLKEIIDQNGVKNDTKEHIFIFDDLSKEGENTKIVPLYMYTNKKVSAFPRLLFIKENMNFGELKKLIYYFARSYFTSPFKNIPNEEKQETQNDIYKVDEELEKYKQKGLKSDTKEGEKEKYTTQDDDNESKLWELFDKEYNEIFNSDNEKKEEGLKKFFDDFPYIISIKREFDDRNHIVLFDGKNNFDNLKKFQILKDEDPITSLLENKDIFLNLVLNTSSSYSISKIILNSCQSFTGEIVNEEINSQYTLDDLLDYFCNVESLDKGNEWKCGKCKSKVNITKKFSLYYVPRLLIICLKRFRKGGWMGYNKNGIYIDFPLENLDMGKYICETGSDREYSKYDLFAVSEHYGDTGGGHYTAMCKNYDGNWYKYDDSSVSRASPSNALSSAAYVLFYRRKNW